MPDHLNALALLATGDRSVFPQLKETTLHAVNNQCVNSLWGHEPSMPGGNSPGYGGMGQISLPMAPMPRRRSTHAPGRQGQRRRPHRDVAPPDPCGSAPHASARRIPCLVFTLSRRKRAGQPPLRIARWRGSRTAPPGDEILSRE
ncbi:MAG: DUF6288 domain-containing protein [Akkermansiaceae bacterium]|nr:DUF6288 domain-containing protein [Akkermansiaceae bacterium]MCF7731036.1 DUF6288 domain-containing protein [Akkermansiaceae bacterium]